MRLTQSGLLTGTSSPTIITGKGAAEASRAQRDAAIPVMWPRHIGGKTVMVAIPPERIPAGWQSIQFHVVMRLATCDEVDCPLFVRGWTEVLTFDGGRHPQAGEVLPDQAAQQYGYYGPNALPPATIWHPAGTACPRIHKVPANIPPAYTINGRFTTNTEFEDALGEGINRAQELHKQGF